LDRWKSGDLAWMLELELEYVELEPEGDDLELEKNDELSTTWPV